MGWTGSEDRDVVTKRQKGPWLTRNEQTIEAIKHHRHANEDWFLYEVRKHGMVVENFIQVTVWDGGYHKEISAACHPYYYGCPVAWLDKIETPTPDQEDLYDWYMQVKGTPVNRCCNCRKLDCPGHEHELIVMAAWGDWEETVPKGLVGVMACLGGRKPNGAYAGAEQHFLVPDAEYAARNTAGTFVVDTARHPVWDRKVAA